MKKVSGSLNTDKNTAILHHRRVPDTFFNTLLVRLFTKKTA